MQMRFMQELIATFKAPPVFLKLPKKRGTFFARKPAGGTPPEPDVMKLLRGLELGIQATPIGARHLALATLQQCHKHVVSGAPCQLPVCPDVANPRIHVASECQPKPVCFVAELGCC